MDTKPKIRQIQLLGSTFVSGYFAFAEFVNYKHFNQKKVIKRFEGGGPVSYNINNIPGLNVLKHDDTIGNIFIDMFEVTGNFNYAFSNSQTDGKYVFTARFDCIAEIPYGYDGKLIPFGKVRSYASSNKSIDKYYYIPKDSGFIMFELLALKVLSIKSTDFCVAFIDMCINTTEPITLNYVGEVEFIQNSNVDNNFTPLFKINRYDYNCY